MKDRGEKFSVEKGDERTPVGTSSVSVHTVNITHLLRRSQTGDAEDPWGSSEVGDGNTRVRE